MKLYVGNLSFDTTESELNQAFSAHGEVKEATLVLDRMTGRSRGFGFVEMSSEDEGRAAITALDNTDLSGRTIKVNEAKPLVRRLPSRVEVKRWVAQAKKLRRAIHY